jgi:hypothetical protein
VFPFAPLGQILVVVSHQPDPRPGPVGRGPIWNHWCWNNKCANVFLFLPPGPSGDVGEKGEIIVGSLVGAISPWVSCPRFAGACAKILVVGSCDSPAHVPSGTSSRQGHRPFGASGTMSPPAACSNDSFFCFGLVLVLVYQHQHQRGLRGLPLCPPPPLRSLPRKKRGKITCFAVVALNPLVLAQAQRAPGDKQSRLCLAINFSKHNILSSYYSNNICYHMTFSHHI